jgi:hypothetical protein
LTIVDWKLTIEELKALLTEQFEKDEATHDASAPAVSGVGAMCALRERPP